MTNVHLPQELYRLIIEEVEDEEGLYHLLFVSRSVNYEAERCLYRTITWLSGATPRAHPDGSVFRTMESLPLISTHVRTLFVLGFDPEYTDSSDYSTFTRAYRSMLNLKALIIYFPQALPSLLDPTLPFRLLKLRCVDNFPSDFMQPFATFLAAQSELNELHLSTDVSKLELPPSTIPNLSTFTCNDLSIQQFIRGRPITEVYSLAYSPHAKVSRGITTIQRLSISHLSSLRYYTKSFVKLKFLQCPWPKDPEGKILPHLAQMPLLENLKGNIRPGDDPDDSARYQPSFIHRAFETCKLLREVELIFTSKFPDREFTSMVWARDALIPG